jgi:hypothetical protein
VRFSTGPESIVPPPQPGDGGAGLSPAGAGAAQGLAGAPKEPVPLWRWSTWWAILGASLLVFYVLLVPVWMGLRAAAWIAELNARRRR